MGLMKEGGEGVQSQNFDAVNTILPRRKFSLAKQATTRILCIAAVILLCLFAVASSQLLMAAQTQQTDSQNSQAGNLVRVPSDPREILKLASETNGLDAGTSKPWHIKVSYDEFDVDGDNVHSGTFEEFYVSPKRYKQIYAGDAFNHTEIANDSGLYWIGDQRWPSLTEEKVSNLVLRPLHWFRATGSQRLDKTDRKFTSGTLPCLEIKNTGPIIVLPAPTACFQPDTVMLRFLGGALTRDVTYNSIVQFRGRYLAKDIAVTESGKPALRIQIEELGEITNAGDDFFAAPEDATRLSGRIKSPPNYVEDYGISNPTPPYPGESGKTTVHMVVGKDGRVIEATADEGPEKIRTAVLKAVRNYQFRPYLVLGEPVEVELKYTFSYYGR